MISGFLSFDTDNQQNNKFKSENNNNQKNTNSQIINLKSQENPEENNNDITSKNINESKSEDNNQKNTLGQAKSLTTKVHEQFKHVVDFAKNAFDVVKQSVNIFSNEFIDTIKENIEITNSCEKRSK